MPELAKITPPRSSTAARFLRWYHRLQDEALNLGNSLQLQRDMLPPKSKRQLNEKNGLAKIKLLLAKSAECLALSQDVVLATADGWVVPVIPEVPGWRLVSQQPEDFLRSMQEKKNVE